MITNGHIASFKRFDFFEQGCGREHNTITNEALYIRTQNTRGNDMKNSLLTVYDERVSGIVATLKSDNRFGLLS